MNIVTPSTGNLYLVVGYDGSAPSVRALNTAVSLMRDREGSIEVFYIAHLTSAEMLSPASLRSRRIAQRIGCSSSRRPSRVCSKLGPRLIGTQICRPVWPVRAARSRLMANHHVGMHNGT